MSVPTFVALCYLAGAAGLLVLFVVLVIDSDRDAIGRARADAAGLAARALVAKPGVDIVQYACRASRVEWPRRVTPTDFAALAHPWRACLVAGMAWVASEYDHGRIPMPWPELRERLRRERALIEATGEFRAIVAASLFDVARKQIEPLGVEQ